MRRSRFAPVGLVLVAALVATGCGGGGDEAAAPEGGANDNGQLANDQTATQSTGAADPNAAGATGQPQIDPATGQPVAADPNAAAAAAGLQFPTEDTGSDIDSLSAVLDPKRVEANKGDIFGPLVNTEPKTETPADLTKTDTTSTTSTTDSTSTPVTYTYGPARVSVNGTTFTLQEGATFPSDTNFFTVEEIRPTSVTIGLTAGQFGNGAQGFFLSVGKSREVENVSEGETYTIKLLSITKKVKNATTTTGY